VRGQGCGVAADRGAARRQDQVRLEQSAGQDLHEEGGAAVEEPLAGGAGVSTNEGGTGPGPLRRTLLARVPPPRAFGGAGLWLLGVGAASRARAPGPAGKKGGSHPVLTLPAVRRGLQRLLAPLAKPDCLYCRSHLNHPILV